MKRKEFDALVFQERASAPVTQRELASAIGVSLGSANKLVKDLTAAGYLDGGCITPAGRQALEPYRVKRAIFLAAGFGSRMVPITFNTPKPLVRVNGTRMIDTLLDAVVAAEIPEIVIVRGYLAEQFDQLLYKYPNIKFVENVAYNETNNISSAQCVRYMFSNAYVFEADLVLYNPDLICKYQYCSNILGIPVSVTDDWCIEVDAKGHVCEEKIGGRDCYQMVGISYWDKDDGIRLANDIDEVYRSPGGKERFWEQVAFVYRKKNYQVEVRRCTKDDVIEIDTFSELKAIDSLYVG